MERSLRICVLVAPLLLIGCVSMPSGPSITSLPGSGKSFDQFRADEFECRQYATNFVGGTGPSEAQTDSAVKSAVVGTAVGALAGAAIGGHDSAGAGAGVGLLFGALAGAGAANASGYAVQQRYDSAYVQCMYAKGHRVPTAGTARSVAPRYRYYAPPAPAYYDPPPPPGYNTVPPPPPTPASAPAVHGSAPTRTLSTSNDRIYIYPRNGQSEARTGSDRAECSGWASSQTGYDASQPNPADPRRRDFQRAISACLEGRGYTVR